MSEGQDANALREALIEAQNIYYYQYSVDITQIYSTSTLSLEIFRKNFQDVDIPIMKRNEDSFIRKAYYGGATDYYKGYGKKLYYYDINSLYPYAMCKPMPLNL